ncbi:hypothetical protein ASD35_24355 [Pelomonas sp. Root1444]|nr:hypothetical protein ASD35_24355 [Pelomonas sp. Root1444]
MDEAGTSEKEPVTVVVGLVVEADAHLMAIEAAVSEILGGVPSQYRTQKNFVFHAKEIWGDSRMREGWTQAHRLAILKSMMHLPRRFGIPIVLSMYRRSAQFEGIESTGMSVAQFQHFMAFGNCIASADRYIRDYARPSEVGTVVAEDVPEMRRFLARAVSLWRENSFSFSPDQLIPTAKEVEQGFLRQVGDLRVTRLRRNIHFVEKGDPMLMVADACAYGFRRFLAEQSFGDEFVEAMLGGRLNIDDYRGPCAMDNFYSHPRTI